MVKNKWPPMAVKAAVLETLPEDAKDAEWPSWREVDERCRTLGRQLLKHAGPRPLKDIYPLLGVSSRGGLHMATILSRVFDYQNPDIRFIGLTSYDNRGTGRTDSFMRGHLPLAEHVEGQDVLVFDEVCDTGHSLLENRRILQEELGAKTVTFAVLDFKPGKTQEAKTNVIPDFFVRRTEKWIVYPWELYEHLGKEALNRRLWDPSQF